MPSESMIIVAAIVTIFACFAGVIAWGQWQSGLAHPTPTSDRKRRAF